MSKMNTDRLLALLCVLVVLLSAVPWMSMSVGWGDDQAAYISDAIAITEGSYDEKIVLNSLLHPSPLSEENQSETRVYVWAYPLMQSLTYRLVGFDRVDYHTVPYYQVPGIICLALLSCLMFLWLRRRFGPVPSAVLALFFCTNNQLLQNVRIMYSDVPFLLFVMLCFCLSEEYTDKAKQGACRISSAVILGLAMWYTLELRANGMAIIAVLAFGHILSFFKTEKGKRRPLMLVLPYVLALVLKFVFERFILYPPTSDVGELALTEPGIILENLKIYYEVFLEWIADFQLIPGGPQLLLCLMFVVLAALFLLGAVLNFRRDCHYLLLCVGTLAMVLVLRYSQGLRYFFPLLPIVVMEAFSAVQWIWKKIAPKLSSRLLKRAVSVVSAAALAAALLASVQSASAGMAVRSADITGAYSPDAIAMYNYIQQNTDEDSLIAFMKPRFLHLNTGRASFVPMINGHDITMADYYLYDSYYSVNEFEQLKEAGAKFEELYRTDTLTLYKLR